MNTQTSEEYFKAVTQPSSSVDWLKVVEELEENEAWLDKSAKIAFAVLSFLRKKKMTKQELAERMGVRAQYVSRIVKGTENLTLETISKLEMALGVNLMEVADVSASIVVTSAESIINRKWMTFPTLAFSKQSDNAIPFITQLFAQYPENSYA
ncbi:MAG: helix-turn-helix transcriptional regulator [Bacteroidales bacterium]|nr:helix-turn-helix transcriptional regulator [Bacteroidales bacterium]